MNLPITGGCLCGAIRYSISAAPLSQRLCYCRLCQYLATGSPAANFVVHTADLTVTGTLADYVSTAESGNIMHRQFCPACGVHVVASGEARPGIRVIRAGTLDKPDDYQPDTAIWAGSAPRWACIDPSLARIAKQPAPPPP